MTNVSLEYLNNQKDKANGILATNSNNLIDMNRLYEYPQFRGFGQYQIGNKSGQFWFNATDKAWYEWDNVWSISYCRKKKASEYIGWNSDIVPKGHMYIYAP